MITIPQLMMVFDVEFIGLHGEGFACGFTVIDEYGNERDAKLFKCDTMLAWGDAEGRDWVKANVPQFNGPDVVALPSALAVREAFWSAWMTWKESGALLFAECLWPVEGRFLSACIDYRKTERQWSGPYPFHDVSSVMLAAGMNPMTPYPREEREQPPHNPLADARQSARLLMTAFKMLNNPLLQVPIVGHALEDSKASYSELVMAVARKFPNETRHQTALRYILEAERAAVGTEADNKSA